MAEMALAVLARQRLARRLPTGDAVAHEVVACEHDRTLAEVGVTWRFTTSDVRTKLARLYPQLS